MQLLHVTFSHILEICSNKSLLFLKNIKCPDLFWLGHFVLNKTDWDYFLMVLFIQFITLLITVFKVVT